MSAIDPDHTAGDHGGNAEKLPSICGVYNLHGVWDSIGYNYCDKPKLPLNDSDWQWYGTECDTMSKSYP